jgi:2-haloacid dehalogenase
MPLTRRHVLGTGITTGITLASAMLPICRAAAAGGRSRLKALAFDAFPVFDPRPIAALAGEMFPGRGGELMAAWQTRQFEYTWLRSMTGRYRDFLGVTRDALVFAAKATRIEITPQQHDRLVAAHLQLKTWADVIPALDEIKGRGMRLAFLSNFTPGMLDACIRTAGLEGIFDEVISTDAARAYKPDPRAYVLGTNALKLQREEILFVAFAGWDAAGAKSFGYPTFWVNRLGRPAEELGHPHDGEGRDLADLVAYLAQA